jgi:multiple sugar transport system permease protein
MADHLAVMETHRNPLKRIPVGSTLTTIALWLSAVLVSFPFIWTVRSSLMPTKEVMRFPPVWIPSSLTLKHYSDVLSRQPFERYIFNSLFVAISVAVLQVLIAAMGAYAFARLQFPGRDRLFLVYLATMIIPHQLTLVPQYVLVSRLGWVDRYPSLIVPSLFSALLTFLLRQFFLTIPRDLEDAARLDGAGYLRTFMTIILPLSGPGLATSAILAFMSSWTSFLWPLIVTRSRDFRTVPVGLASLRDEMGTTDFAQIMAGTVLAMVPMFILFVLLQRYIVQGVAASGLKG